MKTELVLCVLVSAIICHISGNNLQEWSHQAEEGTNFALYCTPTDRDREPNVTTSDILTWFKRGSNEQIMNDPKGPYRVRDFGDVMNAELVVYPVTAASTGIYFCKVNTTAGEYVGTIVKGLNLAGPKFSDKIEHYKDNIITGAIAGGVVFFIIFSACFIDNFRYLTPEQKQKKQDRKQERLAKEERHAKQDRLRAEGVDNFGMDIDDTDKNQANGDYVNTTL